MTFTFKARTFLQYILLLFFVLLLFPEAFFAYPQPGLDTSWAIALNLAWKYHLTFGKDFLFTYGPLGVLHARYPFGVSKFLYLFFDIYFLATIFFTIRNIFKEHFNWGVVIFIFFCIMGGEHEGVSQWYYFFFCYYLFSFVKEPRRTDHLLQAALLSVFTLYVKVSLGMTTVFMFLFAISYALIWKKWGWKWFAGALLSYFLILWASARIFNVNLKGYILGSLQLIDGYNGAMASPVEKEYLSFVLIAVFVMLLFLGRVLYLIIVSIRRKRLAQNADDLFIQTLAGLAIFVLFKSAFVRGDGAHAFVFFNNFAPIGGFTYLYLPQGFKKKWAVICCWTGLILTFVGENMLPGSWLPGMRILKLSFPAFKASEMNNYFHNLKDFDGVQIASNRIDSTDNEYRAIIGNHTVDIIPTEISTIYFKGLHYAPRPVIQSYSAYTEYLDSLNAAKYRSATAPDYILFTLATVDGRVPFFDESRTKMAMLERYSAVGEIGGNLLLKRKETAEPMQAVDEDEGSFPMGEDIPVKKTPNLQFSRIYVRYNLWGNLQRVLFQPPFLRITFTLEDGEMRSFRAAVPVLADGVLLNKFMESEDDFQLLMQADGQLNTNVASIRFDSESPLGGFKSGIKMENRYYRYPQKTPGERREDSLGVAKLNERYNSYKPVLLDSTRYTVDSFAGTMGSVLNRSKLLKIIDAWAFREKDTNTHIKVSAIARSSGKLYELPSESQKRPDLTFYFQRPDVGFAGFRAKVSKALLPPGDYQLGMLIVDTMKHQGWIRYTATHAMIRSECIVEKIDAAAAAATGEDALAFGMSPIKENSYRASVDGWAFVKGGDSKATITHLILLSGNDAYRISTDSISKTEVATRFNDPRLEYCGFTVAVPKDRLPNGVYAVGIEKPYSKGHCVVFTGQKIAVGIPPGAPAPLTALPPVADFAFTVEVLKDKDDAVTLSGWAIQRPDAVDSSFIEIVLKGDRLLYTVPAQTKARPDVIQYLKSKYPQNNCGFFVKIPKASLPAGKYEVGIHVYQPGNTGAVKWTGKSVTCP